MLLARRETSNELQIFDETGVSLGSVTQPTDPRLFGADKGTVYLQRTIPSCPTTGGSAQAA